MGRGRAGDVRDHRGPGAEDDVPGALPAGTAWRADLPGDRNRARPADRPGTGPAGARGNSGLRRTGRRGGLLPARPAADLSGRRRDRCPAVQGTGSTAVGGAATVVLPGCAAITV